MHSGLLIQSQRVISTQKTYSILFGSHKSTKLKLKNSLSKFIPKKASTVRSIFPRTRTVYFFMLYCSDLDIDKDGNITYQEFKRHVEDSVVREALGVRETTTIDDIGDL